MCSVLSFFYFFYFGALHGRCSALAALYVRTVLIKISANLGEFCRFFQQILAEVQPVLSLSIVWYDPSRCPILRTPPRRQSSHKVIHYVLIKRNEMNILQFYVIKRSC